MACDRDLSLRLWSSPFLVLFFHQSKPLQVLLRGKLELSAEFVEEAIASIYLPAGVNSRSSERREREREREVGREEIIVTPHRKMLAFLPRILSVGVRWR